MAWNEFHSLAIAFYKVIIKHFDPRSAWTENAHRVHSGGRKSFQS
jgi:hypothetical protein